MLALLASRRTMGSCLLTLPLGLLVPTVQVAVDRQHYVTVGIPDNQPRQINSSARFPGICKGPLNCGPRYAVVRASTRASMGVEASSRQSWVDGRVVHTGGRRQGSEVEPVAAAPVYLEVIG